MYKYMTGGFFLDIAGVIMYNTRIAGIYDFSVMTVKNRMKKAIYQAKMADFVLKPGRM